MPFYMAAFSANICSHVVWSRPHTSESVSRRDPPILSILILQSRMDLVVVVAHFIFPIVSTDKSLLSTLTALPTWLRCCYVAVRLLVSSKSLGLRHPTSTVPSPLSVRQKSFVTTRLKYSSTMPAGYFKPHSHVASIFLHAATTPLSDFFLFFSSPYLLVLSGR